jgi:peptidyl-prolyl cis-trans isomerase D
MKRFSLALAASLVMLTACDGFREAMTAHVDVVARAGDQELTTERLAELMGNSQIPLNDEAARTIANLWVDYQLLGLAAANNDSLNDPKMVDDAMWAMLSQARATKWHEQVQSTWAIDSMPSEATYLRGDVIAAAHILIGVPAQGLSQGKQDSMQRVAERIAREATPANFASLVEQYTMDPGSKEKAGIYVVPRGQFVPEFEQAVFSLQPGEITKTPVRSQFGWHIIRRLPYSEVEANHLQEFSSMIAGSSMQVAESTYLAGIEASGEIEFRKDAAATIKKVMQAPDEYKDDKTVIATSTAGNFTADRLARWISAYPPQQRAMMRGQAAQAPDSVLLEFTRAQFIRGELVLAQADSAKVELTPEELSQARNQFSQLVHRVWAELKITPPALADSAEASAQRERVASEMVETYMDQLVQDKVPYVEVPMPLSEVLREKYDYDVNSAGITRSLERAARVRAVTDSTRAAQQPQSQVPLGPQGAQPGTQPQAQPPQQQVPPPQTPPAGNQQP